MSQAPRSQCAKCSRYCWWSRVGFLMAEKLIWQRMMQRSKERDRKKFAWKKSFCLSLSLSLGSVGKRSASTQSERNATSSSESQQTTVAARKVHTSYVAGALLLLSSSSWIALTVCCCALTEWQEPSRCEATGPHVCCFFLLFFFAKTIADWPDKCPTAKRQNPIKNLVAKCAQQCVYMTTHARQEPHCCQAHQYWCVVALGVTFRHHQGNTSTRYLFQLWQVQMCVVWICIHHGVTYRRYMKNDWKKTASPVR